MEAEMTLKAEKDRILRRIMDRVSMIYKLRQENVKDRELLAELERADKREVKP